jgi:hypothetical protein
MRVPLSLGMIDSGFGAGCVTSKTTFAALWSTRKAPGSETIDCPANSSFYSSTYFTKHFYLNINLHKEIKPQIRQSSCIKELK